MNKDNVQHIKEKQQRNNKEITKKRTQRNEDKLYN